MANPIVRWIGKVLNLTDDAGVWSAVLGTDTDSGESVTPDSALQCTTVWACARGLSELFAQLPGSVFESRGNGQKRKAEAHQIHYLIHHSPNRFMTPVEFKEAMMLNLVLWGNGYALMGVTGNVITSLTPLLAQNMSVEKKPGGLLYRYWDGETEHEYDYTEILHLKGFGFNGLVGLNPIQYCREAIGMALKSEEFGARMFKQGALPGALIKFQERLEETQRAEFTRAVSALLEGAKHWEYQQISINPEDAQFMQVRKMQVEEITRIFRWPRHMVGDLDRATFSNIEVQDLEVVKYTLMPYITRWEQAMNKALFAPEEQGRFFLKFNVDALLRGDMKSRSEYSSKMVQNGIMTRNEVRDKEDLDRHDQKGADDLTVQSNMVDLDQLARIGQQGEAA